MSVYYDDERPGVDAYVACGAFGGDELWAVPRPESKLCVKDFRDCICLAGMKQRFEVSGAFVGLRVLSFKLIVCGSCLLAQEPVAGTIN